jgi:hypothetical protein
MAEVKNCQIGHAFSNMITSTVKEIFIYLVITGENTYGCGNMLP